ncbi:MAG TPA: pyrroline-5-carboxylate reductase dimerization domain-containing protein, partial [Desulfuromonadales bacterium]|nr:pyrroline-5-carboxylate reductase dimerization domain-containing protein [Desulfuromonadales bacterium]
VREVQLDAVTGLSGSGPAYVFTMIEALADGGVQQGLARDVAQSLAVQTVLGAARLVQESGEHPAALRDKVCSPGGTAISAVKVLEEKGLRSTLMEAVARAAERSRELGDSK